MPINFDDYISTSLRWSMFKADWPDATVEFSEGTAADAGIPASFSKKTRKSVLLQSCVSKATPHSLATNLLPTQRVVTQTLGMFFAQRQWGVHLKRLAVQTT